MRVRYFPGTTAVLPLPARKWRVAVQSLAVIPTIFFADGVHRFRNDAD